MICTEIAPGAKKGRGPPELLIAIQIPYVHDFGLQTPKQQPAAGKIRGHRSAHSILVCYSSNCIGAVFCIVLIKLYTTEN